MSSLPDGPQQQQPQQKKTRLPTNVLPREYDLCFHVDLQGCSYRYICLCIIVSLDLCFKWS
jgi:hypothetical protein